MKKLLLLLGLSIILMSCKSNEKKALELINKRMFTTLFDYSSYEPIETSISEAYTSIYTDSLIRSYAITADAACVLIDESLEKAQNALDYADIYAYSYYGSGRRTFNKYMNEAQEHRDKATLYLEILRGARDSIVMCANRFDPQPVEGWEVTHKFRVKSKGGNYNLANYVFLIDKKFKNIISEFDIDDDEEISIRSRIDSFLKDKSSTTDIDDTNDTE